MFSKFFLILVKFKLMENFLNFITIQCFTRLKKRDLQLFKIYKNLCNNKWEDIRLNLKEKKLKKKV